MRTLPAEDLVYEDTKGFVVSECNWDWSMDVGADAEDVARASAMGCFLSDNRSTRSAVVRGLSHRNKIWVRVLGVKRTACRPPAGLCHARIWLERMKFRQLQKLVLGRKRGTGCSEEDRLIASGGVRLEPRHSPKGAAVGKIEKGWYVTALSFRTILHPGRTILIRLTGLGPAQ